MTCEYKNCLIKAMNEKFNVVTYHRHLDEHTISFITEEEEQEIMNDRNKEIEND